MTNFQPKNALSLIPLIVFVTVSLAPHNALAFEAGLSHAANTSLEIPVHLAGRDPYLAMAIEGVPNYNFTDTAGLIASRLPITERTPWPTAVPAPRVAYAPAVAVSAPVAAVASANSAMVLEGTASYYSRAGCLGCNPLRIMANGQPLDDNALTMAIGAHLKHLVGHKARVTSLTTGQAVEVRITDTGGFYQAKYGHRVADLSVATKQAIGMKGGLGQVRVEVF